MGLPKAIQGVRRQHEPCGCQWQEGRWVLLCPRHASEFYELHEQARREHNPQLMRKQAE